MIWIINFTYFMRFYHDLSSEAQIYELKNVLKYFTLSLLYNNKSKLQEGILGTIQKLFCPTIGFFEIHLTHR